MHAALTSRVPCIPGVSPRPAHAGPALRIALWASLVSVTLLLAGTTPLMGAPVFLANSQAGDATSFSYQRSVFRDGSDYFWAFYFDGTNTYYERSDDTTGASWTGTPALLAARIASALSPMRRMTSGCGPMNLTRQLSQISAKWASSARKP